MGRKGTKKKSSTNVQATGKSRLNILGRRRDQVGLFSKYAELEEKVNSPSAELSDQLSKALSFDSNNESKSTSKPSLAYKISIRNNIFARKTIKLSSSIKVDTNKLKAKIKSEKNGDNLLSNQPQSSSGRRRKKKKVKSNNEIVADKIASSLGEGSSQVTKLIVESLGTKEAMKICNLATSSEDCVVNFHERGDFDSIQSPLDIYLMFIELDESISKDKRRKLLERVRRVRKQSPISPKKNRSQRRREVKLLSRNVKSIANDLVNLNLTLAKQTGLNDDSNEENKMIPVDKPIEDSSTSTAQFVLCPSRLQINEDCASFSLSGPSTSENNQLTISSNQGNAHKSLLDNPFCILKKPLDCFEVNNSLFQPKVKVESKPEVKSIQQEEPKLLSVADLLKKNV